MVYKGEPKTLGPYEVVVVEQSGDDGRQIRFELLAPYQ